MKDDVERPFIDPDEPAEYHRETVQGLIQLGPYLLGEEEARQARYRADDEAGPLGARPGSARGRGDWLDRRDDR